MGTAELLCCDIIRRGEVRDRDRPMRGQRFRGEKQSQICLKRQGS